LDGQISRLRTDLENTRKENQDLKSQLKSHFNTMTSKDTELIEMKKQLKKETEEFEKQMNSVKKEFEKEKKEIQTQVKSLEKEAEMNEKKIGKLDKEIDHLKNLLAEAKKDLDRVTKNEKELKVCLFSPLFFYFIFWV